MSYAVVEAGSLSAAGRKLRIPLPTVRRKIPELESYKVFDVAIEGVSYLASFRGDFAEEIEQRGLDELIARLEGAYGGGTAAPAG